MNPDTIFYNGFFKRDPLLARDSLLFRNGPVSTTEVVGKQPQQMPLALRRNDIVTGSLLVGFAMLLIILRAKKRNLATRISEFMYPSRSKQTPDDENTAGNTVVSVMLALLTSLFIGLLFFSYAQSYRNIDIMPVRPVELLVIYVGIAMAVEIVNVLLYNFVNNVFFNKQQIILWRRNYSLLYLFQCTLLFPLTLTTVYFDISVKNTVIGLIMVLLLVKIPLLFKAYTTFFVKNYGVIHIFVYFCALEAVPLVILWSLMSHTTSILELF